MSKKGEMEESGANDLSGAILYGRTGLIPPRERKAAHTEWDPSGGALAGLPEQGYTLRHANGLPADIRTLSDLANFYRELASEADRAHEAGWTLEVEQSRSGRRTGYLRR